MQLNQIYEALAQNLGNGLNAMSEIVKFDVKTSYNHQESSKDFSIIKGVMNFSNNDVAPIENLDAYTLPAIVSFYCVKEYANEVMAILTKFIDDVRGIVQQVGEYYALPTYTTPSQGDVQMIGQLGESTKITMFIEYTVYKNLLITNDITVLIDGEPLLFNEIGTSKQKACDSDSLNNNLTARSIPLTQSLTFSFSAFITSNMKLLVEDILSLKKLDIRHTLTLTINNTSTQESYQVILLNADVNGVVGGAMYGSLVFGVAEGQEEEE